MVAIDWLVALLEILRLQRSTIHCCLGAFHATGSRLAHALLELALMHASFVRFSPLTRAVAAVLFVHEKHLLDHHYGGEKRLNRSDQLLPHLEPLLCKLWDPPLSASRVTHMENVHQCQLLLSERITDAEMARDDQLRLCLLEGA